MTPSSTEDSSPNFSDAQSTWKVPASESDFVPMQKLQLGPTPAQLGYRRNGQKSDSTAKSTSTTTSDYPSNSTADVKYPTSDGTRDYCDSIFREKFVQLPEIDFKQYSSPTKWALRTTMSTSPNYESFKKRQESKQNEKLKQTAPKKLIGNRFFGPDFSPSQFNSKFSTGFIAFCEFF